MNSLMKLICVDPSNLGRVDYASLPQQALMEMVVDGITNREIITGSKEDPKDISEWKGVTVDDTKHVTGIVFICRDLAGILSMQWLPPTVGKISIWKNELSGTIDLAKLPVSLTVLDIRENHFIGEVDLSQLPENLKELIISKNAFTGSLNFKNLPELLEIFAAEENRFTGTIDLTLLPDGLRCFDVSSNQLVGSVDLTALPEDLAGLYLDNNAFCGTIDLRYLPEDLEEFDVSENANIEGNIEIDASKYLDIQLLNVSNTKIRGTIVVQERASNLFKVENSSVKLIFKK